jgi:tetratricopeptide (TPR) repeat protein
VAALCAVLTLGAPPVPLAAQDPADVAWDAGDVEVAARLYAERVARDSTDRIALHRLALIRAWAERYDEGLALFDRLLALEPDHAEAEVDRARVLAWRGDLRQAMAALDRLLARRPGYVPALQARAQFAAWAGELEGALRLYDLLLEITPEDRSVRSARARTLGWASRFEAATAAYDSLLRGDPADREALLGLALILSWSDRLDSAQAIYGRLLQEHSTDGDALKGLARTHTWSGNLVQGERAWRRALAGAPDDVEAMVGLAQALRWQGRDAAALEVLRRAQAIAPTNGEVRTQMRWAQAATAPRVGSSFVYENDSDGNRIATLSARAAWRPVPRVQLGLEGYTRDLDQTGVAFDRRTRGAFVELWTQAEPGWTFMVGGGVSEASGAGAEAVGRLGARVASPARYRVGGTLGYSREALDVTAELAENGVIWEQVSLELRGEPAPRWSVTGGVSRAAFEGAQSNRRIAGSLGVWRRLARDWTAGVSGRAFGFQRDVDEGYFDPEFYGLAELAARWQRELGPWLFLAEGAPGIQALTGADLSASARLRGLVGYRFAPGREIALTGAFSSTGLQVFAAEVGTYRYRSVSVSASWAF